MPTETLTREIFRNIGTGPKAIFYGLAVLAGLVAVTTAWRRIRRWRSGRTSETRYPLGQRVRALLSRVLSQATLAKTRPAASRAHRCLFGGFAVLTLGTILIAVEHVAAMLAGRAADDPVFHKGLYYAIYEPVMELAGLAVLIGAGWFLLRRRRADSSIGHRTSDWLVLASLLFLGGLFTQY